ncbi:MAG: hypothetical protein E7773_11720 [Sphingomonas sp.]|uniref:hypothetical protein n=1 Tax=Sphingomonas sp. TaxID=28214 RepID=UPI001200B784|nr:hypothetical protein [Sphingomonas sp.]THD35120.1 MAG: hypothetical protein E7773_11720 [Sphingomonas sp.]
MKYIRVVECVVMDDRVRVELLREDQQTHRFEVGAECAGLLTASLATEVQKLNAETRAQQFIRPTGMQTGRTEQGEPMLFLSLEDGVELPLVFKPESVRVLISELEKLMNAVQPEHEIRWQ